MVPNPSRNLCTSSNYIYGVNTLPVLCCVACGVEARLPWPSGRLHSGAQRPLRTSWSWWNTHHAEVTVEPQQPEACAGQHPVVAEGLWCAHLPRYSFPGISNEFILRTGYFLFSRVEVDASKAQGWNLSAERLTSKATALLLISSSSAADLPVHSL